MGSIKDYNIYPENCSIQIALVKTFDRFPYCTESRKVLSYCTGLRNVLSYCTGLREQEYPTKALEINVLTLTKAK